MPVRMQTINMETFVKDFEDEVYTTAECGNRLPEQLANNRKEASELIGTVLSNGYVLPILIKEDEPGIPTMLPETGKCFDGNNRITCWDNFYTNDLRLSKKFEGQIVKYMARVKDENGKCIRDDNGKFMEEEREFDCGNHTYEELPKELQQRFNKFQVSLAIFSYDEDINKLIRFYNHSFSFNTDQTALTFIPLYASNIREVMSTIDFFKPNYYFPKSSIGKGYMETIIGKSVMMIYFKDKYITNLDKMMTFLNENANEDMFNHVGKMAQELCGLVTDEISKRIFTRNDSPLWIALMDKFVSSGLTDMDLFAEFLDNWFEDKNYSEMEVNGSSYADVCGDRKSPKYRASRKYNKLIEVMNAYLIEYGVNTLTVDEVKDDVEVNTKTEVTDTNENEISENVESVVEDVVEDVKDETKEVTEVEEVIDSVKEVIENSDTSVTVDSSDVVSENEEVRVDDTLAGIMNGIEEESKTTDSESNESDNTYEESSEVSKAIATVKEKYVTEKYDFTDVVNPFVSKSVDSIDDIIGNDNPFEVK